MRQRGLPLLLVICVAVAVVAVPGCGPAINVPAFSPVEMARLQTHSAEFQQHGYRIETGDTVTLKYPYHPEMDQETVVRPDGRITVSGFGNVDVAGRTATEVVGDVKRLTSTRLKNPEVVVNVQKFSERPVFVGGEVGKPGSLVHRRGMTPLQAVIAAGGFLPTARLDSVILVRQQAGADGQYLARKLDLERAVHEGEKEPIELAPNDIVFVPKTAIANANLWVKQHISDMIPRIPLYGF